MQLEPSRILPNRHQSMFAVPNHLETYIYVALIGVALPDVETGIDVLKNGSGLVRFRLFENWDGVQFV